MATSLTIVANVIHVVNVVRKDVAGCGKANR